MPDPNLTAATHRVADAIKALGTADAITPFGAIEEHTVHIKEAIGELTDSLNRLTTVVEEGLADIAKAIRQTGPD